MKPRQTLKLGEKDTMYEPCFLNYRCTYDPALVSIQTKRRT